MWRLPFFILLLALIAGALAGCAGMETATRESPIVGAGTMRCSVAFTLRANRSVELFGLSVCKEIIRQGFGAGEPKPKTEEY